MNKAKQAQKNTRRLGGIAMLIIVSLLLSGVVFASFYAYWLTDRTTVTAQSDSFTVSNVMGTRGSVSYVTQTLLQGNTPLRVDNLNTDTGDASGFDIVVIPTNPDDTVHLSLDVGTAFAFGSTGEGQILQAPYGAVVYTDIACPASGSVTVAVNNASANAVDAKIAVFRHTPHNYYVGTFHQLKMADNAFLQIAGEENIANAGNTNDTTTDITASKMAQSDHFANVYVVSPFTVETDYRFHAPGFFHLLWANVMIEEGVDFSIKHGYGGLYSMDSFGGRFIGDGHFSIFTPYAYYKTERVADFSIETLVAETVHFSKISDGIDLDDPLNAHILTAVKEDAKIYLENTIDGILLPGANTNYTTSAFILPTTYHHYAINYSYTSSNANVFTDQGMLTRQATSAEAILTCTVSYQDTSFATIPKSITVIGTDNASILPAYIDALGAFVVREQLPTAELTTSLDDTLYGVDVWDFTTVFVRETGINLDGSKLCFPDGSFQYELRTTKTVDGETIKTVKLYKEATFAQSGEVISLAGLDAENGEYATQLIIHRPYFSAAGEGVLALKDATDTVYTSSAIHYIGCPIEERNRYLNSKAPNMYLAEGNTVHNLLNISEKGTFIGPEATGVPLAYTHLSSYPRDGKHINYNLYYFNENANKALVEMNYRLRMETITDEAYANMLTALIAGDFAYPELSALIDELALTDLTVETTYDGKTILGDATAHFTYEDGVLSMNTDSLLVVDGIFTLVATLRYEDAVEQDYYVVRSLYSPESGLGGAEIAYGTSRIFDKIFKETENFITLGVKELDPGEEYSILSIAYTVKRDSMTYPLEIITPENPNPSAGSAPYVRITYDAAREVPYQIEVIPNEIPTENTTLTVTITMDGGAVEIVENYFSIIPGVYLYERDIEDIRLYYHMLKSYGNKDGYLTSDALEKNLAAFDCSENALSSTLSEIGWLEALKGAGVLSDAQYTTAQAQVNGGACSIEGIQHAKGTHAIILDGLSLLSLAPFARMTDNTLVALSMENCAITTAMLQGSGTADDPYSPLYTLNNLKELSLAYNKGIVSLVKHEMADSAAFYRTIERLSLRNCYQNNTGLNALKGIEGLVNLVELYIENNAIKSFDALLALTKLEEVYLGNNITADSDYGTHGKTNLCTIVALMNEGVHVFVEDNKETKFYERIKTGDGVNFYYYGDMAPTSDISTATGAKNERALNILSPGGYLISSEQEYLAVVLNACFDTQEKTVSASNYADALDELFPSNLVIGEYEYDATSACYSVKAVDLYPSDTSTQRVYRVTIQYSGTDAYRFLEDYYETGVSSDAYMQVSKDIHYDVTLS